MTKITIPARATLSIPEDFREVRVREGRSFKKITLDAEVRSPLVVNYGMGTDSTALLVLLVEAFEAGDLNAKPDLIIFGNTGSEKANTYAYLPTINAYLAAHNFPTVTVVAKADRGLKDATLHDSSLRLQTMPSLAYGGKSCSLKWKVAEMEHFLNRWAPAQQAWAAGLPVVKAIGYDASPADLKRCKNEGDEAERFWYPLRDAGIRREELKDIIARAGLPQPGKSACFMCPASKRPEVLDLLATEPAKLAISLKMEATALLKTAKKGHLSSTIGLGRNWSWRAFLALSAPTQLEAIDATYDAGATEYAEYLVVRAALEAYGAGVETLTCDIDSEEA